MKRTTIALLSAIVLSPAVRARQYSISTYAGGGVPPAIPVPALRVTLSGVQSVAADARGNVYFLDGNAIFRLSSGAITRVALAESRESSLQRRTRSSDWTRPSRTGPCRNPDSISCQISIGAVALPLTIGIAPGFNATPNNSIFTTIASPVIFQ